MKDSSSDLGLLLRQVWQLGPLEGKLLGGAPTFRGSCAGHWNLLIALS